MNYSIALVPVKAESLAARVSGLLIAAIVEIFF